MCVTDPWAHMSLVHSILSLKLGVTDTPPHLEEFDRGYIREYSEEVIMRRPVDTHAHPMLNYE